MSIDPTALAQLQLDDRNGKTIACAQILKVTWAAGVVKYYAASAFQTAPFLGTGFTIEPRLLFDDPNDPFFQFEINADLRTDEIKVTFDNVDKTISNLFLTYKSGRNAEIYFYYPAYGILASVWFGQLVAPQVYGWSKLETIITNGFRSREQNLPSRRPQATLCTANFGGLLPTAAAVRSNGCRYDRHVGGTLGTFKTGSTPWSDCPKTEAACDLRFGTGSPAPPTLRSRYWLGFKYDASAVRTDGPHSGYLAISDGNDTRVNKPIVVIAGVKHLSDIPILLGRQEDDSNDHAHGFHRDVYMVGEGPVSNIYNVQVNGKYIEQNNLDIRYGTIGQLQSNYAGDVSNFSLTAHFPAALGWVDARTVTSQDMKGECDVVGYADVYTYVTISAGAGLVGKFYADQTATTEVARRIDTQINFLSSSQPPVSGERLELGWLTVWTGFITFPSTGTVTISGPAGLVDDYVDITVNGAALGATTFPATYPAGGSGTFAATGGVPYPIVITYKNFGAAPGAYNPWGLTLKWSGPGITGTPVIPGSAFTHSADAGFVRQWTDDRVWWLLECYTNQRWGLANDISRFNLPEIEVTSLWGRDTVSYTQTFPDAETAVYAGTRTTFNAIMEGRAVAEQIEDICRCASLAVPFQHDGQYTIQAIRQFTVGELAAAPVFADRSNVWSLVAADRPLLWDGKTPSITLSQTPDDKVINEVVVSFEDATNFGTSRSITVDNPNQKKLAGTALGDGMLKQVPKNLSAYGATTLQEALRFGHRVIQFGEFDEGGTENNWRLEMVAPLEWFLDIRRYGAVKVVSELVSDKTVGTGTTTETLQYFRVLSLKKIAKGGVKAVLQAYNKTAYDAFETVTASATSGIPPVSVPASFPSAIPQPPVPVVTSATWDATNQAIVVTVT